MQFNEYDPQLITAFDVIGSYFVDTFYNHLYQPAVSKSSNTDSVNDTYRDHVKAYMYAVKSDKESYNKIVNGLHKYYIQVLTAHTTTNFASFIDLIVSMFVPKEYYSEMSIDTKDELFNNIICGLVGSLGAFTTQPDTLNQIIKYHDINFQVTIRQIQERAITILLAKRDMLHHRFLNEISETQETVSYQIVDNLKRAIKKLVREKADLQSKVTKLKDKLDNALDELDAWEDKENKYKKIIKLLQESHRLGVVKNKSRNSKSRNNKYESGSDSGSESGSVSGSVSGSDSGSESGSGSKDKFNNWSNKINDSNNLHSNIVKTSADNSNILFDIQEESVNNSDTSNRREDKRGASQLVNSSQFAQSNQSSDDLVSDLGLNFSSNNGNDSNNVNGSDNDNVNGSDNNNSHEYGNDNGNGYDYDNDYDEGGELTLFGLSNR